jgi:hypothetical protein
MTRLVALPCILLDAIFAHKKRAYQYGGSAYARTFGNPKLAVLVST